MRRLKDLLTRTSASVLLRRPTRARIYRGAVLRNRRHIDLSADARIERGAVVDARRGRVSIGEMARVASYAWVEALDGNIEIGQRSLVNVFSAVTGETFLGDDVLIAQSCVINAGRHVIAGRDVPINLQGYDPQPVRIESGAWIGANAVVAAGVTIGEGAIVGAGAFVNRDVEPYTIVGGVPARFIRRRFPDAQSESAA